MLTRQERKALTEKHAEVDSLIQHLVVSGDAERLAAAKAERAELAARLKAN